MIIYITSIINDKGYYIILIDLELARYKYIVNVTIMENKCAGAR